ncbi:hypothetical protein [Jannaschia pohangensis]|uniref:SnoaL-like domain-containing protein n=1 Tax=Jannaschia pohangensis TaxID=390807 RepID=A0A1I3GAN1_9RHOB|nr:hypothetical protein [Jannaschia pohangensis]SFI20595.1 hypothetical protein SAMN04488095_0118 [Jannaschia pohangensis]
MQSARDIYQRHLDIVSEAVWRGDMATVSAAMSYPHEMQTNDSTLRVETPEDLQTSAIGFVESLRRQGATDYHRVCTEAEFATPGCDRIDGQHMVHVLKAGTYVTPPFASWMSLALIDGVWLGIGIRVAVRNSQVTVLNPALVKRNRQGDASPPDKL